MKPSEIGLIVGSNVKIFGLPLYQL